jgi:hypothetical protein
LQIIIIIIIILTSICTLSSSKKAESQVRDIFFNGVQREIKNPHLGTFKTLKIIIKKHIEIMLIFNCETPPLKLTIFTFMRIVFMRTGWIYMLKKTETLSSSLNFFKN